MALHEASTIDDDMYDEIDAMQTIARTLARMDPGARVRILHWINERFNVAPAQPTAVGETAHAATAADPTLTVDGLDLFSDRPAEARADGLDLFCDPPAEARADGPIAAAPDAPLDSVVRGFANDFKRFAIEWQSV
jgi:hypothetical protein